MKIIKRKSTGYPRKVIFDNDEWSYVPDQRKFKTDFIKHHGCSLAGFFIGLGFKGHHTTMLKLYAWAKRNLKHYKYSKFTIKGVSVGINKWCRGEPATYHRSITYGDILKALKKGHLVLLETGNPIHTNVLYMSNSKTYHLDHGGVKKVTLSNLTKNATLNDRYRGWVDIK